MAGPGLTLTLHDAGKFNDAVQNVIGFIDKLDDAFDKIVNKINKFESELKESANNLNNIGSGIEGFAEAASKLPTQKIKSLSKSLAKLDKINFSNIATGLNSVAQAMSALDGASDGGIGGSAASINLEGIDAVFKIADRIDKLIPKQNATDTFDRARILLERITPTMDALQKAVERFRVIASDNDTDITRIRANINSNIRAIQAVVKFTEQITKLPGQDTQAGTVSAIILRQIRDFEEISNSIEILLDNINKAKFDPNRIKTAARLIRAVEAIIAEFSRFDQMALKSGDIITPKVVVALRDMSQTVTVLVDVIERLESTTLSADLSQVARIRSSTATLLRSIVDIVREFDVLFRKRLETGTPQRMTDLLRGIKSIAKLLSQVVDTLTALPNTSNFPAVAKGVRDLLTSLPEIVKSFAVIGTIGDVNRGDPLDRLSAINDFIFGGRTRLTRFLQGIRPLARLLAQVATILAQTPNIKTIGNVGNLFTSLSNIVQEFKKIDLSALDLSGPLNFITSFVNQRTRLTRFFQGIIPLAQLLRRVGNILGGIKRIDNVSALSKLFDSISQIVNTFRQIDTVLPSLNVSAKRFPLQGVLQRMTRLTRFFGGIIPLARLMRKAANVLSKLRGSDLKSVEVMGRFIQSLSQIIAQSDQLSESGIKNLSNAIKSVIRDIEQGFKAGVIRTDGFEDAGVKGGRSFLNGFKRELEIRSPAGAMIRIGKFAFEGFKIGIGAVDVFSRLGVRLAKAFTLGFKNALITNLRGIARVAANEYRNIGQNLTQVGQTMFSTGSRLLLTGGLSAFFASQAISGTAEFGQTLRQIQVLGSLTDEALSEAQRSIEDFSAATQFGPNQSAQAFLDLQKAGLDVADSIAALPQVGDLAAAGMLEIADASSLAIRVMNGFNLEVQDLTRVNDALVGAADISTAAVADIGQAMSFAAPNARALGISIEELSAAIALNTDRGLEATRAGTGLRVLFDSLVAPTDAAQKALDELGVVVADADGNFRGLPTVIEDFEKAIAELEAQGVGEAGIFQLLAPLGDQNAITTLLNLLGDGALNEYITALEDANSAQEVAAAQMDTFRGVSISLGGSLVNLKNRALMPLLEGPLKELGEDLIVIVNAIAALPEPILSGVAALGLALVTITSLSGAALILGSIISLSLGPAFRTLGILAAIYANPIAAMTTAIATITGLAGSLVLFGAVAATLGAIGTAAALFFREVKADAENIRNEFNRLLGVLSRIFTALRDMGQGVLIWLGQTGIDFERLAQVGDSTMGIVSNAIRGVTDALKPLARTLEDVAFLFQAFAALEAPEAFNATFDGRFDFNIRTPFDDLVWQLEGMLGTFENDAGNVWEQITGLQPQQRTITVETGDTLFDLAREYDTTVERILELNDDIENSNLIFPGQELILAEGAANASEMNSTLLKLNKQYSRMLIAQSKSQIIQRQSLTDAELFAMNIAASAPFKRLFGEDEQTTQRFVATIRAMDIFATATAISIVGIAEALKLLFAGDFVEGFDKLELSFSRLALSVLEFAEVLFGFELGDAIRRALVQGNLALVGVILAEFLGDLILDGLEITAPLIGFAVSTFISGALGALPLLLGSFLGINILDPIRNLVLDIGSIGGAFAESFINNAVNVLRGDITVKDAVTGIINDVADEVKSSESLQNLGNVFGLDNINTEALNNELSELINILTNVPNLPEFALLNTEVERFGKIITRLAGDQGNVGSSVLIVFLNELNNILEPAIPFLLRATASVLSIFNNRLEQLAAVVENEKFVNNLNDTVLLLGGLVLIFKGAAIAIVMAKLAAAFILLSIALEAIDEYVEVFAITKSIIADLVNLRFGDAASQMDDLAISLLNLGGAILKGFSLGVIDLTQLLFDTFGVDADVRTTLIGQWEAFKMAFLFFAEGFSLAIQLWTLDVRADIADFFIDMAGSIDVSTDFISDLTGVDIRTNLDDGIREALGSGDTVREEREGLERELDLLREGLIEFNTVDDLLNIDSIEDIDLADINLKLANAPQQVRDQFSDLLNEALSEANESGDQASVDVITDMQLSTGNINDVISLGGINFGQLLEQADFNTPEGREILFANLQESIDQAFAQGDFNVAYGLTNVKLLTEARFDNIDAVTDSITLDPATANISGLEFGDGVVVDTLDIPVGDISLSGVLEASLFDVIDFGDEVENDPQLQNALETAVGRAAEQGVTLDQIRLDLESFGLTPESVDSVINGVIEEFGSDIFTVTGENVVNGVANGIESETPTGVAAATTFAQAVEAALDTQLEIESPSKVAYRKGIAVVDGMALGIEDNITRLTNATDLIVRQFAIMSDRIALIADGIRLNVANMAFVVATSMAAVQSTTATVGSNNPATPPATSPTSSVGGLQIPSFNQGGFTGTGSANDSFVARLHRHEFVVPQDGALVLRDQSTASAIMSLASATNNLNAVLANSANGRGGSGMSIIFNGDMNIGSDANGQITPEVVADGIRQYANQNPPQRNFRDYA